MSLKYYLVDNKLTPDPEDCVARTTEVRIISFDELLKIMTSRGLTLTDTEVMGVFNEFLHAVNDALQNGYAVSTPFVKIKPGIVGVFLNKDDVFDPSRHAVRLNVTLGSDIKIDQKGIKAEKVKAESHNPEIVSVKDYQTQRENEAISRNGTVEIKGTDLKIDPDDVEQGVFIINNGQEVKVTTYMHNKPSLVIFLVPGDVPDGEVLIQVRNKQNGSNTLRQGTYEISLAVI